MKKLGFGTMRLPINTPNVPRDINIELFKKMVDEFIENGFTYFDTAYMYHDFESEKAVKKALVDRYPRDKYTITTKLPLANLKCEEDNEKIFSEQLEKLGVEYVDIYLMHALNMQRYENIKKFNTFEFMKRIKKEGRAKHIGFSYHDSAENLDKILNEIGDWVEFVQLQLNYFDWDSDNIQSRKCYEVCLKHNKQIIVMEPVRGGVLHLLPEEAKKEFDKLGNASYASYAIRYCASLNNVYMVLSGMSTYEQLKDNVSYMKDFKPITSEELDTIKNVVRILENSQKIGCTACRYCTEKCPKGVKIPEIFALYNDPHHTWGQYHNLTLDGGNASSCIECGVCESMCPQHLEIRKLLKDCAVVFRG